MDPQTLAVLGRLTAYGPWAIVLGLLIMNLHRFTDAYDAVSATRLRNRAAKQTLAITAMFCQHVQLRIVQIAFWL